MEIEIFNLEARPDISREDVRSVTEKACQLADMSKGSCFIIFQGEDEISALHNTYFQDPSVTDVITFNLGEQEIEAEIYICLEQAGRQAGEYGVSLREETSRLIIHGILHLMGYRDDTSRNRQAMKEREDEFLSKLKSEIPDFFG